MTNNVVVDFETHKHTKVITKRGAEFGENIHFVPVVADELRQLVLDYAVVMIKDPETGQFGLHALLGFDQGENLYLQGEHWRAQYAPMHIRRQPFIVGRDANDQSNALLAIDMDNKRVQEEKGEALFNEDGSSTEFLDQIQKMLASIMGGLESTAAFINALAEQDLIDPARLDVTLKNGEQLSYGGIYTISEEKLSGLSRDELHRLYGKGYLQAAYMMLASIGHVKKLIAWRNELID